MCRRFDTVLVVLAGVALLNTGCGESDAQVAVAAASPTPTATAAAKKRYPKPRFATIQAAVDSVEKHVDVPVVVPAGLPKGTVVAGVYRSRRHAQISVRFPDERVLTIQYGEAGFDGCGPHDPRSVKVGSVPGVVDAASHGDRPYTTLIWPATVDTLEGQYGLSGEFTPARMMAFAESMQQGVTELSRADRGC